MLLSLYLFYCTPNSRIIYKFLVVIDLFSLCAVSMFNLIGTCYQSFERFYFACVARLIVFIILFRIFVVYDKL